MVGASAGTESKVYCFVVFLVNLNVLLYIYIYRKDPPPQSEHCQCILTVRHISVGVQ